MADTPIESLIAASPLGTPEARLLAATVPSEAAKAVVARAHQQPGPGMCRICHGEPAERTQGHTDLCADCAEASDHSESLTAEELALDRLAQQIHVAEAELA